MKRRDGAQAELARLSATQDALFTYRQAIELGLDDCWLRRQRQSGLIVREHPRVYRYAAARRTVRQQLMAMTLRAPGMLWVSHRAAGDFWQLDEIPTDVLEFTTCTNIRSHHNVIVHRVDAMPSRDVTVVAGLALTTVHRTLIDLGAVVDADTVEIALECALRRRITTVDRLLRRLDEVGGRGRRGAGVLSAVIQRRDPKAPPTDSALEVRFLLLVRRHRLPTPVRQQVIRDEFGFVARVDFIFPEAGVIVEVESRKHHLSPADWERDLRRHNRLAAQGKRVLRTTYHRMQSDSDGVAAEIRTALRAA
jgi:very-short-patch-repair endonuclease